MNVLISGGGIAGAAAALFLKRAGHAVRVIDRAPSFQKRGYAITLKNFGLELMAELGLADALASHAIPCHELRVYEPDDRLIQSYSRDVTQKLTHGMVLSYRSELHAVLYEAARAQAPIRFGLHVASVEQDARAVRATLSDGTVEQADLLVVAEGVHSTTRRLLWGERGVVPFDVTYLAATMGVEHGLDVHAMHGYVGDARNVLFIPTSERQLLIQCYLRSPGAVSRPAHPRDVLVESFQSYSPRVRRWLDAIPSDADVFCDSVSMIDLPSLSCGRVVLLGDAGYCPTFLSGMGASLGLLGAKVLSTSLAVDGADLEAGLARYQRRLEPLIEHFHANARSNVDNALPQSHLKGVVRNWLMHLLPPAVVAMHFGRQFVIERKLLEGVL